MPVISEAFITREENGDQYAVHLIVPRFPTREEARQFAQNFMVHGSLFVLSGGKKTPIRSHRFGETL
ncbi:MAG: hypothetical protein AB7G80_05100 [Dongiaceae bacterium]